MSPGMKKKLYSVNIDGHSPSHCLSSDLDCRYSAVLEEKMAMHVLFSPLLSETQAVVLCK